MTPIVVAGVMYLPARGNQVLALDADSGQEIWRYQMPPTVTTTARGVAYWPGEGSIGARILLTAGPRLLALDAQTGRPSQGFGRDGFVEITVPWNGVPVIYKHVAILGTYPGEVPLGAPGDTRAFDVRTGKKLWQFQNVPLPGQPGHETWLDYGWRGRSGTNVWAFYMTIDAERGILYMPVSSPAANYWGGDCPGNNLFGNSIVAVDAETGKYRWHFQTVHHDVWDFDMPSPPVLVDIMQNGRRVPALASIGKTGYMFILNRVTGKPIFGVEERPVPEGRGAGRMVFADAAVSGEAVASVRPCRVRQGARHGASRGHDAAACRRVSGAVGQERRIREQGAVHAVGLPRGWRSATQLGAVPRSGRRGQLGWSGGGSRDRAWSSSTRMTARWSAGMERKKPGLNYGRNTEGFDAALRSRVGERPRTVFQFHRAAQRRQRAHGGKPAVLASAVGEARCRRTPTPARSPGRCRSG